MVRQLLEPVIRQNPGHTDVFAGAAAPAARLFEPDDHLPHSADMGFEALHSLYWLMVNIADHTPVLVSVDDCQWADRDSLRFLAYLAQRIEGLAHHDAPGRPAAGSGRRGRGRSAGLNWPPAPPPSPSTRRR